jgi:hypothetical protein
MSVAVMLVKNSLNAIVLTWGITLIVGLLSLFPAQAQEPLLWQWRASATELAQQDPQAEQQVKTVMQSLSQQLRKSSPNGLPSLRWIQFEPAQLQQLLNQQTIDVSLPTGQVRALALKSQTTNNLGVQTITAQQGDTELRLHKKNDAISGTLIVNGERWKLTVDGGVGIVYLDADMRGIGEPNDGLIPPELKNERLNGSNPNGEPVKKLKRGATLPTSGPSNAGNNTDDELDDGEVVQADLFIVYTAATVDLYGGEDAALTRISDVMDATNQAYLDSNVYLQVNLIDAVEVDFDPENTVLSEDALDALTGYGERAAELAHARAEADRVGADFLVMLRPYVSGDSACGIAWLGGYQDGPYSAGGMVSHTSIDCSDVVNAHELGHNMGLSHSRRQDDEGWVYPYALGHGVDNEFATIMAYPAEFSTSRVPVFSSPELDCRGLPCGVDHTDPNEGADAVLALNKRRAQIATIRELQDVSGELLVLTAQGPGQISFDNEICEADQTCSVELSTGSSVTLTAEPGSEGIFVEWGGACTGAETSCEVQVNQLTNVIAYFEEDFLDIPIGQALDNDELSFSTDYQSPWRAQDEDVYRSDSAMRSYGISDSAESTLSTIVEGYGELTFYAKVSSEADYDGLIVRLNGEDQFTISGEQDWQQYSITVQDTLRQENLIEFIYSKDGGVSSGKDRAWLDNVQFASNGEGPKSVTFVVYGDGYISGNEFEGSCQSRCELMVNEGSSLTLSAAATGTAPFVGWGGDCRGTDDTCALTMDDNRTVYAFFTSSDTGGEDLAPALDAEGLSLTTGVNPWRVVNDSQAVGGTALTNVDISDGQDSSVGMQLIGPGDLQVDFKVSSEEDWDYFRVYLDGSLLSEFSGERDWSTLAFSLEEGTHDITFSYEKDSSVSEGDDAAYIDNLRWDGDFVSVNELRLRVSNDQGAIRSSRGDYCRSECSVQFVGEETVTLYAEPNPTANFIGWEGACSGSNPVCELTLAESSSVQANFSTPRYTVTGSAGEGGVVSPAEQRVTEGETAQLTATPLVGYALTDAAGCDGSLQSDGRTFITGAVFADCTVTAEFDPVLYTVSFDLGDYGTYTGGGALEQSLSRGESAIAPEFDVVEGWAFAGWSVDFSYITESLEVQALYQPSVADYTVALNAGSGGRINLTPQQYINEGSFIEVLLTPERGYRINKRVTGTCPAGDWQGNTYRFGPISSNCDVNFSFVKNVGGSSLLLILTTIEDNSVDQ